MNTKLIASVCLAVVLTFTTPAFAMDSQSGAEFTTGSNSTLYFSASDFSGDESLEGIMITQTPSAIAGSAYYRNRALNAGDVIPVRYLDQISFVPRSNYDATATFEYMPVFAGESPFERMSFSISVMAEKDTTPLAENVSLKTYKNISITSEFMGSDEDGDILTYSLTSDPKRGTVEIDGSSFTYTPKKNKVGKDKFYYIATDEDGNESGEALVTIQIEKPTTKVTYSDMAENDSYYAALRLVEEGIFTGESLGGQYFFLPDRVVNRGEFLAMVINMIGIDSSEEITETGFADDSATPVWVKPYISTALKSGIISGVAGENGSLVFRSEATLTKAEAAVILNNALQLSDEDSTSEVFSQSVPTWAYQAAVNLRSYGIWDDTQVGSYHMSDSVTRSDAAEMLCDALDLLENRTAEKSLLSWAIK